ncbi:hypothetical protein BDY17DRAFT_311070 [Neohortaea acidophila]|uniref:FR47-like domain-containing protein n=1 Tax=Neohortaea acidophila TaxID=245834 RepID=A0A6A6PRK5_9PEZI|nr:uncharacterized protein BDY17DRAFT_311070 [Neohortaea acidophila]KAF2482622.1 hypothetical protein BDY17DRAFT_311070 [Neohortaea acidophila]
MSVNRFPVTGGAEASTALANALKILKPHLPASIPLYRRLQFGRFFDASCLLTNLDLTSASSEKHDGAEAPWLMAFVDRSCRPESEVWLAASWEYEERDDSNGERRNGAMTLMRELVQEMKNLPVPISIHQDVLDAAAAAAAKARAANHNSTTSQQDDLDSVGLSRNHYGGHAQDSNIMLWGAVHERSLPLLKQLGVLSSKFQTDHPNFTFVWDVDALRDRTLPEGLRWGKLRREDFALVRSRTQIPRQDRTMAVLPNLAIFPRDSDQPISWAFVGLDGSLTTLHVEPAYRGKGLAKTITTKLFKEKMERFQEDGLPRWAHGYVIVGNQESEGMCRSLGGKSGWEVYWLRVDLGLV